MSKRHHTQYPSKRHPCPCRPSHAARPTSSAPPPPRPAQPPKYILHSAPKQHSRLYIFPSTLVVPTPESDSLPRKYPLVAPSMYCNAARLHQPPRPFTDLTAAGPTSSAAAASVHGVGYHQGHSVAAGAVSLRPCPRLLQLHCARPPGARTPCPSILQEGGGLQDLGVAGAQEGRCGASGRVQGSRHGRAANGAVCERGNAARDTSAPPAWLRTTINLIAFMTTSSTRQPTFITSSSKACPTASLVLALVSTNRQP